METNIAKIDLAKIDDEISTLTSKITGLQEKITWLRGMRKYLTSIQIVDNAEAHTNGTLNGNGTPTEFIRRKLQVEHLGTAGLIQEFANYKSLDVKTARLQIEPAISRLKKRGEIEKVDGAWRKKENALTVVPAHANV